jgi:hypothetical protein
VTTRVYSLCATLLEPCATKGDGFMDKNHDALTVDLAELMDSSKDPFVHTLFAPQPRVEKPQRGKITLVSFGYKFKIALESLMEKLRSTRSSFIRCSMVLPSVQKVVRMFLHMSRYVGVRDISNFKAQIPTLTEIVDRLPKNKEKYVKVSFVSVLLVVLVNVDVLTLSLAVYRGGLRSTTASARSRTPQPLTTPPSPW